MIKFYSQRAKMGRKWTLRKLHGRTLYKIWEYMHVETSHAYQGMNRGKWRHLPNKCRRWERAIEGSPYGEKVVMEYAYNDWFGVRDESVLSYIMLNL